jgi:hypothetical protein
MLDGEQPAPPAALLGAKIVDNYVDVNVFLADANAS